MHSLENQKTWVLKKMVNEYNPKLDESLKKVQLWSNGIMLTLLSMNEAKEMIRKGHAKPISDTAISTFVEE